MIIFSLWVLLSGAAGPPPVTTASGISAAGLYYEASGAGEPVVLIHGFSLDRRMWEPQIAPLEKRFRVIRYDLRGHGKSAAPDAPYAPVEDLASVLDALGLKRATLVGLSAGAELATDFAIAHPDRVTRLVLAAPGLGGYKLTTPLTWMAPVFAAAGAGEPERAAALWAGTPIMALHTNTAAAALVREIVSTNSRLWTYKSNPAKPLDPPAIHRLAEVRCPALILVGDQDLPHIKEVAGLLAGGIAGAKQVTVPGAGHLINLDQPAAFNEIVGRILGAGSHSPTPP